MCSVKLHYFGWLPGEDLSGWDCRFSIIFIQLDEHCAGMYFFIILPVSVQSWTKLAEEIRWMNEMYVRETRTNCQWEQRQIRKERGRQIDKQTKIVKVLQTYKQAERRTVCNKYWNEISALWNLWYLLFIQEEDI